MSDDISSGPRGARGELESNRHQQIVLLVHISISGPSEGASWEMMGRGQTTGCQGCFFFFLLLLLLRRPNCQGSYQESSWGTGRNTQTEIAPSKSTSLSVRLRGGGRAGGAAIVRRTLTSTNQDKCYVYLHRPAAEEVGCDRQSQCGFVVCVRETHTSRVNLD